MRTVDFFQFLAQALYALIFVVVLIQAVRRPRKAIVDIALFFGASAMVIAISATVAVLGLRLPPQIGELSGLLIMALPYLLLRLVADFAVVRPLVMRGAEVGLALSALALFALPAPMPVLVVLLLVAYFLAVMIYATAAFGRQAGRTGGVTRRRMQAVALGTGFLGLDILVAGLAAAVPALAEFWMLIGSLCGLASGLCYFLGFTPPTWLRRAWQAPELRAFLGRAASLPYLPDTRAIVAELERGAATAVGAPSATIGLWDEERDALRFYPSVTSIVRLPPHAQETPEALREPTAKRPFALRGDTWEVGASSFPALRQALTTQRPVFVADAIQADPAHAAIYRTYGIIAILAAPITAGAKRLGVLQVYAARAPIFADSDLELVRLLADQAAVILESRALIDEAAQVRAREEATRLKEDFLSSAAHDLKTPLTGILTQAQVLKRRMECNPAALPDLTGIERIIGEARRLSALVRELLDAARIEQGQLVTKLEEVDLVAVARAVCARQGPGPIRCVVEASGPVRGQFDAIRIQQLLDNLVENAVKFSRVGGEVTVRVWRAGDEACLIVRDRGIGIPLEDLPRLFERFHRGRNVDDRRFAGLGLGLYICKGIVEQHGGRIWAESAPGQGSAFHIALPLSAEPVAAEAPAAEGDPARA